MCLDGGARSNSAAALVVLVTKEHSLRAVISGPSSQVQTWWCFYVYGCIWFCMNSAVGFVYDGAVVLPL